MIGREKDGEVQEQETDINEESGGGHGGFQGGSGGKGGICTNSCVV
jgi:hypothetical protein